jgi:hypothetical protein
MRQWVQNRAVLAVRTALPARTLFPSIIDAIHSVDPEQAVYDLRTMDDVIARSLAQRRITTVLMVAFGVISLVLAAVGVYGVVAFGVSQRMREFGITLAGAGVPGITLQQSVSAVLQITQASTAALSAANEGATVTPTGTITFNGGCTTTPQPTN